MGKLKDVLRAIEEQIYFHGHTKSVMEDIDEYAKQLAVDFTRWYDLNAVKIGDFYYRIPYKNDADCPEPMRMEELFELYKSKL